MLKKKYYLLFLSFAINQAFSQVLYSERFNGLTLLDTGYTNINSNYFYKDIPTGMYAINVDTLRAEITNGNYPFKASGQQQKGWLSYVPSTNLTDTFAVSTSWLKPIGTASAWLITPVIDSIKANTVLSWEAMAPDINNADGYEVYITTNTFTTPVVSDFSTLVFSAVAELNTWQTHGISLASFAGQKIRIAFKNNSTDKYQLWLDDIKVENIANQYDVATLSHSVYKYSAININNTISATFKNNGYAPITNLTINYKIGNGTPVPETKILSPPLNYLESREIPFSTLYNSSIPAYNTFTVWSSDINGQPDTNPTNDVVTGGITISQSTPTKKVLVEQYTDASCSWCPEAYIALKSIVSTNTNVIAASIHNSDSMSISDGSFLIGDYAAGIPSASVDHFYFPANKNMGISQANWNTYITQRLAMTVPATVSVTAHSYDTITRLITATVSTNFVGDVEGDYRLNLYIKENNVYGPMADSLDNGWNQHNASYSIPASPYYQYGNFDVTSGDYIMSAASYKHQYVINHIVDNVYGGSAGIPLSGSTSGNTYSKVYSYTLPPIATGQFRFNADNIYLIGMLSEYNFGVQDKTILNVDEVKLTPKSETVIGVKEIKNPDIQLSVFPNPTSDVCHLNFNLKNNEYVSIHIYNTLGELVYIETKTITAGNIDYILNLNALQSGNYSVQVSFGNNSITKKLTIIK